MENQTFTEIVPVKTAYRNFVLFMLTIVYIFNFIDRQILVILQESIKADLNLSDTQLGLLSGFTFAIFYVTVGLPIARYADKGNRKNIITAALTVWSVMTAISGMAQNFVQLLLARIGVGVGEAGASPPAHSMISDYFPERLRAKALSIYSAGIYLAIFIGYPLGGYLGAEYGWRIALIAVGIPGVVFAAIFYLSIREPARAKTASNDADSNSFVDVLKFMFTKKSFIFLAAATGLHTFTSYGIGNWMPSFMIRVHGMDLKEAGTMIGLIAGTGGVIGAIAGGIIADKFGAKDKSWYFKVSALGAAISIPFAAVVYFSLNQSFVLAAFLVVYICNSVFLGPSIAITHSIVKPQMRAFASAILFLVLNLIGLGFGPLVVGMISDYLEPTYGVESLRYALSFTMLVSAISVGLFMKASKHIDEDLASVTE